MVVAAGADVGLATSAAGFTPGVDDAEVGAILAETNGFQAMLDRLMAEHLGAIQVLGYVLAAAITIMAAKTAMTKKMAMDMASLDTLSSP